MNETQTKLKAKGFSMLITSLTSSETTLLDKVFPPKGDSYSLPSCGNFQLWQAFHIDLKSRKNPDAAMAYVKRKSAWLAAKYDAISKEKNRDIFLDHQATLLSGISVYLYCLE